MLYIDNVVADDREREGGDWAVADGSYVSRGGCRETAGASAQQAHHPCGQHPGEQGAGHGRVRRGAARCLDQRRRPGESLTTS